MSQWTHINAIIRLDFIDVFGMRFPDMSNVPEGSEGPMQINIWKNPHPNSAAAYTISCWGDLRDYSDKEEILRYFNSITKDQMIRSGLLEIHIESDCVETFQFANKIWNKL